MSNHHKYGTAITPMADYSNPSGLSPSAKRRLESQKGILVLCAKCKRAGGMMVLRSDKKYEHFDCENVGRANRAQRRDAMVFPREGVNPEVARPIQAKIKAENPRNLSGPALKRAKAREAKEKVGANGY